MLNEDSGQRIGGTSMDPPDHGSSEGNVRSKNRALNKPTELRNANTGQTSDMGSWKYVPEKGKVLCLA